MRIIHTSDWHLGQYFYGKSRANEHQQFLSWLIEQVKERNIDAVIVAGDIFDTSSPPSYAREIYFEFVAKLHLTGCQLIILAGNHDSVAMLSEAKSVLNSLSSRVISHAVPVINIDHETNPLDDEFLAEQVFPLLDKTGKTLAIICAVPFIRPRDVIKSKSGQSVQDKQQNLQQAIKHHYDSLYEHALLMSKNLNIESGQTYHSKIPIIATGHLTALGVSVADSNSDAIRDIYIGSLEAFPADMFPPADYVALGHIHRSQKVAKSEHIRYCGSPIALSFDEASQVKKVLLVEFASGGLTSVEELAVPCFQPLYSLNTALEDLEALLQEKLSEFKQYVTLSKSLGKPADNITAWLNIEVIDSHYVSDLSQRVNELVISLPFEVLLVRRCKNTHQQQPSSLKQVQASLDELSLVEVFDSRLSELAWETEQEKLTKIRLKKLYEKFCNNVCVTNVNINKQPQNLVSVKKDKAAKLQIDVPLSSDTADTE